MGGREATLVVLLFLLPVVHPVLRTAGLERVSHLIWLAHLLPVALIAHRFGRRAGGAAVAVSVAAILFGERMFGGGFGDPASWETATVLGVSVGLAELLTAGYVHRGRQARARPTDPDERDALTGLPSRQGLERILRETAREGPVGGHRDIAVLFLDLDRFRRVNDSLGHAVGDEVLRRTADRLRESLQPNDLLARAGGDDFVVVLRGGERSGQAVSVARRLVEALGADPMVAADHRIHLSAAVGVASGSIETDAPGAMIRDAATALRHAKQPAGPDVVPFRDEMSQDAHRRLHVEAELRNALAHDQFELHYQPIFAADGRRLRGAEALLRWRHPDRGLVSPGAFLPVVREAGLTVPVGSWVIEAASRQAAAWGPDAPGEDDFVLSFNLDAPQFSHDGFDREIVAAARRVRESGARLEVEVTENELMSEIVDVGECLERLCDLGVDLAVDDFGTGYSSLRYLNDYPMDVLKIDRSFVCGPEDDVCNPAIARTILALARNLGLETVAEGVETRTQYERLDRQGVDYVQGYHFGRPVPPDAFREEYLRPGGAGLPNPRLAASS